MPSIRSAISSPSQGTEEQPTVWTGFRRSRRLGAVKPFRPDDFASPSFDGFAFVEIAANQILSF